MGEIHGRTIRAEAAAELTSIEGGDWHPFRRKWVTERVNAGWTLKQIADAGGWKDIRTLEKYARPDEETMFKVASEVTKLRDANTYSTT